MSRPDWWSWELEISLHALERMIDRSFSEVDLRQMLEDASQIFPNHEPGRWAAVTSFHGREWEIILEPVDYEHILIVVTAYPVD